jgi:hypothetical protein
MTVIPTANADWDVLTDIRDTLAAAEVATGAAAFKRVVIGEAVEPFARGVAETPAVLVVPVHRDQDEPGDSDTDRVTLMEVQLVLRCRAADARDAGENRVQEIERLANLAANALMADPTRGGAAEATVVGGRLHPATRIGRRRTLDGGEGFAMVAMDVTCALVHGDEDR